MSKHARMPASSLSKQIYLGMHVNRSFILFHVFILRFFQISKQQKEVASQSTVVCRSQLQKVASRIQYQKFYMLSILLELFTAFWELIWRFLELFGIFWNLYETVWNLFENFLGPFWSLLELFGTCLKPFGAHLKTFWDIFGVFLNFLVSFGTDSKPVENFLGSFWSLLEPFLFVFRNLFLSLNGVKNGTTVQKGLFVHSGTEEKVWRDNTWNLEPILVRLSLLLLAKQFQQSVRQRVIIG